MNAARPLLALAALLASACAPPARCPELAAPAVAPSLPAASSPPAAPAPAGPRVAVAIHPSPGAPTVDVEVDAAAEPEALATFSFAPPGGAAALHVKSLRDDRGSMEAQPTARPDGRVELVLPRRAVGEVHIAYSVAASPRPGAVVPGVDPDANVFQAAGEPLLLLPDGLDDRVVHATVGIAFDAYVFNDGRPSTVGAASSFGVGASREVDVTGHELRFGLYFAGPLGRALFSGVEGHDEAAWFGYTSFDPRPIAADVAAFRTAATELFRGGEGAPLTLLVVSDGRLPGAFAATRRARSVLVRVGTGEAWTGPVRIAVAVEILHGWIGSHLWVGPDDPAHEAEAYWFTEGVTRQLARDLLFRFGLVTPREVLDEVHGLAAVVATSPRRGERLAELAAHAKEPGAVPLLVARGALYATAIHARLRAKSKHGIEDVLRALYQKAREARGALPAEAWVSAVAAELGAGERAAFEKAIGEGKVDDLPDDALGPCFHRAPRTYEAFDLGFDLDATIAAPDRKIAGLRPGGPAARAGLLAGDVVVDTAIGRGRSDVPVRITVKRGDEEKTVKYLPAGAKAKGTGFARRADVPDDACTK